MFIVVDWNKTEYFGPFVTKDEAEEWLAKQGIPTGHYEDQEVSVTQLQPLDAKLKDIL